MATPMITAIVPSYNSASVLPRALDSIMAQTHPVAAVIVVDDGSSDDTPSVVIRYANVQYVHQSNQGASAARNHGVNFAKGDWLAFLDADDEWEPEKLQKQVALLAQHREARACMTAARVWSPHLGSWTTMSYRGPSTPHVLQRQLLVRNVLSGICSSLLIHRDLFDRVGGFAVGKCSEDRRIAIEILKHAKIFNIDEPLIRQQPGPAHFQNPETQRGMMLALLNDYRALFHELSPTGLLKLRAHARIHERSGMHYLENGNLAEALYDLTFSALQWPWQKNPWRVFVNAVLGRAVKKPVAAVPADVQGI